MKPFLLAAALALGACAGPFDPWAWRVEVETVCTFVLSPLIAPSCQRVQCEVRGPVPSLPLGARAAVVEDRRERRNCRIVGDA